MYADGEAYDSILELSEALGVTGNPWSIWAAELDDGRLRLNVIRDAYESSAGNEDLTTNNASP